MTNNTTPTLQIDNLFQKISHHIDNARNNIVHSVNSEMVQAYWLIGRDIVVKEQNGHQRAQYGKHNYYKRYLNN